MFTMRNKEDMEKDFISNNSKNSQLKNIKEESKVELITFTDKYQIVGKRLWDGKINDLDYFNEEMTEEGTDFIE